MQRMRNNQRKKARIIMAVDMISIDGTDIGPPNEHERAAKTTPPKNPFMNIIISVRYFARRKWTGLCTSANKGGYGPGMMTVDLVDLA